MFEEGQGVQQDDVQAAYWYQQAAGQGHSAALYNLGLMYANGQGVQQDLALAYALCSIAAKEDTDAAESREQIFTELTPEQVGISQMLINQIDNFDNLTQTIKQYLKE